MCKWRTRAERLSYIKLERARVAAVAALAQEHTELRVDVRAALGVSERVLIARRALAQDRHRGRRPLAPLPCPALPCLRYVETSGPRPRPRPRRRE